jgi:predicted nucleic acid-binding Zn ribbon protein
MKRDPVLEDLEKVRHKIEQDLMKETEQQHQEKTIKRKRKTTIIISIILVLIILSYLYLSYPVYDYLQGIAGSSKINNNEINFQNKITVTITDEVLLVLQDLYDPFWHERALCLTGTITNNKYEVTSYYKPSIHSRGWNFVSHSSCIEETIIMLHTHPLKRCTPSETDKQTLQRTKRTNPEIIMMIMCGQERFSAVI